MSNFEPRKVPVSSLLPWSQGSIELASRKPISFVALWVIVALATWMLPNLSLVHAPVTIVAIAISVLIAEAADKSASALAMLRHRLRHLVRPVLFIAVGYALFATLAASLMIFILDGPEETIKFFQLAMFSEKWIEMAPGEQFLFCFGLLIINANGFLTFAVFLGWFSLPLTVCARVPLRYVAQQSFKAFRRNLFMLLFIFSLNFAFDLAMAFPLLGIPLLSFLACLAYLSYKDIWLGQTKVQAKVKRAKQSIKLATQ